MSHQQSINHYLASLLPYQFILLPILCSILLSQTICLLNQVLLLILNYSRFLVFEYHHKSFFPSLSSQYNFDQTKKAIQTIIIISQMLRMQNTAQSIVDKALSKLKKQDLEHRGFLKPLQITLKTQHDLERNHKAGSLPNGIKIVFKESIGNNKFELFDVVEIRYAPHYSQLKKNLQHNLLSMMKKRDGIEVAICVCMYSQNKRMLKSTLAGIKQNIAKIVTHENINSDKIGVFVMMDGIDKVDSSIVEYFQELQRENNINLGENTVPTLTLEQMERRAREKTQQDIDQEQLRNVNNFLFTPAQLLQRNSLRFSTVKEEYDNIRKLISEIDKLKQQKIILDNLPIKIHPFVIKQAKELYQRQYNPDEIQFKKLSQQKILEEYSNDLKKMTSIIMKALSEARNYCIQYIKTKEDLAYLASYRVKIKINQQQANQSSNSQKQEDDNEQSDYMIPRRNPNITHMNLFLCVKYRNSGKLSSHNWFFNGFCRQLRPRYAVLLDVGLRPSGQALQKMYQYMIRNPTVGGVCGYMSIKIEQLQENQELKDEQIDFLTNIASKFNNIQRTQQVQYHFAHLIDKPFQASFGFIHVLPGAYSAYNMNAIIQYDEQDDELLKSYFKSIDGKRHQPSPSNFTIGSVLARVLLPDFFVRSIIDIEDDSEQQMLYNENIYLAEDRILCMGIHKKRFNMAFLPDAYAEVDPMKTVHGLLGQRKRWINGSFFAFQRVKQQLRQHQQSNGYECFLHMQMLYLTIMNMLSYLAPVFFLFTIHIAMEAFRDDVLPKIFDGVTKNIKQNQFYNGFVSTIDFIYVMMVFSIIFFSLNLNNNHKKYKSYLYLISTIFGIFSLIVFIVLLVDIIRGIDNRAAFLTQNQSMSSKIPGGVDTINILRWILIASTGIYVFPIFIFVILYKKIHVLFDILLGSLSFLFYGPTYLIILNIYALCRIDDISWGTKGLDFGASNQDQSLKSSWRKIKFIHVAKYIFWNIITGVVLLNVGSSYATRFYITIGMVAIMSSSLSLKILIGSFYMIKYKLSNSFCCKKANSAQRQQRSRIQKIMQDSYDQIIYEVRKILEDVQKQFDSDANFRKHGGSFIQASRKKNAVKKSFQKIKMEQLQTKSKIIQNNQLKKISLINASDTLQTIKQQESDDYYRQQRLNQKMLTENKKYKTPGMQDSIVNNLNYSKQKEAQQDNISKSVLNQSFGSSDLIIEEAFKQGKKPIEKKYQKQKKLDKL